MQSQSIPLTIPLLVATLLSGTIAGMAWSRRRQVPGAQAFTLLMLAVAFWSLTYAGSLASRTLAVQYLWDRLMFLGIATVPVAWLLFVLHYLGKAGDLTRARVLLLFFIPALVQVAVWTNGLHGQFYTRVFQDPSAPFPMLTQGYGPLFWLHAGYANLLLLVGTYFLLHAYVRFSPLHRRQALVMLVATGIPWLGNIIEIVGVPNYPDIGYTPFAFTLTGLLVLWGVFRYRLLDLAPLARATIIENMSDSMIVLDLQHRIVDINPAARRLMGVMAGDVIGKRPSEVFTRHTAYLERYRDIFTLTTETLWMKGTPPRCFELRISPITHPSGQPLGRLIVLREITDLMRTEAKLRQQEAMLRSVTEATPLAYYVVDVRQDTVSYLNRQFCELWGITHLEKQLRRGELTDTALLEICLPRVTDPEALRATIQRAKDEPFTGVREDEVALRDGRTLRRLSTYLYDTEGQALGFLLAYEDITARIRAAQALADSEEQYRLLFNTMTEGFAVHEAVYDAWGAVVDYRFIDSNPAFEQLTGQERRHTLGRTITEVLPEGGRNWVDYYHRVRQTGLPQHYQHYARQLDRYFQLLVYSPRPGQFATLCINVTERKRAEERLNYLAYYDNLTGLPNRFLFHDRLSHALEQAARHHTDTAVLFIDLDRFKEVNDTLGHHAGDELLRAVAKRFNSCIRKSDTVARLGGDEFVLILSEMPPSAMTTVELTAQRILQTFNAPFHLMDTDIYITPSIGITIAPNDGTTVETLMKNADLAMYRAKERGRNNYCFFAREMSTALAERRVLEQELRKALEQQEFELYYQPQVSLVTGKIVGVEALLRWVHPTYGLISPLQFIPVAEETGLIRPIGEWVLKTACTQVRQWQRAGAAQLHVAVNLSARQFDQQSIVDTVQRALEESGLAASSLELEITESIAMRDTEYTIALLHQLRAGGTRIAIDDFGTGHCSFGYLKRFPVDTLKIDRTFIHDIQDNEDNTAIVQAIIHLGQALGLTLIAECVETNAQLDVLREQGCDLIQGYLFSRPLPADECARLIVPEERLVVESN